MELFLRLVAVGVIGLSLQIGDADASQPRRRGKALNFHGIGIIQQVPNSAWRHRRVVRSREFESLYAGPEDGAAYRKARRDPKTFLDALLEVPSPATRGILSDLGIPAVDGVPPIAVLWGLERHPSDEFSARLGLRR